ncbi:MAG: SGNH/GDSL hydrolase family protein [Planctomycetes bacterium]|nr:SGNH/GDSL hydrolase family protein [Planctomycetota bacterium]
MAPVSRRRRTWLFRLLVLGIVSLLCGGLLEGLVRVFVPQPPSWLAIYQRHPRLPTFALQPSAEALVETGEARWRVHTDAQGHRCAPPAETPAPAAPVRPEVLWLGDSFVFGHGADYQDCWVGLLASAPDAGHSHCNTGVPGYGPTQYREVLEDELAQGHKPAVVVAVSFLGNDFHDTVWNKDVPVMDGVIGGTAGLRSWLKRSLHSYRLVSQVYHRITGGGRPETDVEVELADPEQWRTGLLAEGERRYRDEFARMAARCRDAGLPFLVVLVPSQAMVEKWKQAGPPPGVEVADARAAVARAQKILADLEIRTVDLTPALAEQDPAAMYLRFDGHFTPAGHQVVYGVLRALPELR